MKAAPTKKATISKVLDRIGDVVLLEKHKPTSESGQKFYEVVLVQHVPKREFPDGRVVECHESMPGPEKWGTEAWSPATLEAARERFRKLTEEDLTSRGAKASKSADSSNPTTQILSKIA